MSQVESSCERTCCAGSIPSLDDDDDDDEGSQDDKYHTTSDESYSPGRDNRCSMLCRF